MLDIISAAIFSMTVLCGACPSDLSSMIVTEIARPRTIRGTA